MEKNKNISQLGEKGLIKLLSHIFSNWPSDLVYGAGLDDCAVIKINDHKYLVTTTDMLHRTTDFPIQMTPWQIGWMAVAVNLSDIASMGANPIGVMMAIGLPKSTDVKFIEEMAKGMDDCAKKYNTAIIGGDIDTHDELTICGTALGIVDKKHLLSRKGAHVGDLLCVTGYVGLAGAGLYALENSILTYENVIKALLEPQPRINESMKLAKTGYVTSMIDTSDGIAISLHILKEASNVGFLINEDNLPIKDELRQLFSDKETIKSMALYTGGDFELIFTVRPEGIEDILEIGNISIIGKVVSVDNGILIKNSSGFAMSVEHKGYEQLKV